MKLLFTTTLLLFGIALSGQYNYGLEVEQRDAKIEEKLNISDTGENLSIGLNAGINNDPLNNLGDGEHNVFIGVFSGNKNVSGEGGVYVGYKSGFSNISGHSNTFIGGKAGEINEIGEGNTYIGAVAGRRNVSSYNTYIGAASGHLNSLGERNTFLGTDTGVFGSGSGNVFIGYSAGNNEARSALLVIENTSSNQPLIFGEFDNDRAGINWDSSISLPATLSVNGTLHISETAKLEPQANVPTCGANDLGLMYVNAVDSTLYLCKGSLGWKEVMVSP